MKITYLVKNCLTILFLWQKNSCLEETENCFMLKNFEDTLYFFDYSVNERGLFFFSFHLHHGSFVICKHCDRCNAAAYTVFHKKYLIWKCNFFIRIDFVHLEKSLQSILSQKLGPVVGPVIQANGGWHLKMTWGQEVCYTSLEPAFALSLPTVWLQWVPEVARCQEMANLPAGYIPLHKVPLASSSGSLGFIVYVL